MFRVVSLVVVLAAAGASVACSGSAGERPGTPPQGDVERGRQAFIQLQCHTCHEVRGVNLPAPSIVPAVALGGRTLLPPSRGQLMEDILLPSTHFAQGYPVNQIMEGDQSRMPDYSKALSNTQLADLVAFLKAQYSLGIPSPTRR